MSIVHPRPKYWTVAANLDPQIEYANSALDFWRSVKVQYNTIFKRVVWIERDAKIFNTIIFCESHEA